MYTVKVTGPEPVCLKWGPSDQFASIYRKHQKVGRIFYWVGTPNNIQVDLCITKIIKTILYYF